MRFRRIARVLGFHPLGAKGLFIDSGKAAPAFEPKGGGKHMCRIKFRGCAISASRTLSSMPMNMFEPEKAKADTDASIVSP